MEDQLASIEAASRARGRSEIDLALLTDGLRSEREQGVTIDVAYRHFSLGAQRFLLIDAPGHVQYTRNMFTGATHADVALILVDATRGFTDQTLRHCMVCAMVGLRDVVLVLNKMDLAGFEQAAYDRFVREARGRLRGILEPRAVIPVSALNGDNVIEPSAAMKWYQGATVSQFLATPVEKPVAQPFLMPVQGLESVKLPDGRMERWVTGRIVSGEIALGAPLMIGDLPTEVLALRRGSVEIDFAREGDSVALRVGSEIEVSRGDLLSGAPVAKVNETRARLFWMSKTPLKLNHPYIALHGRKQIQVFVSELASVYDIKDLGEKSAALLQENEFGIVSLKTSAPIPAIGYSESRTLGSFVLIDPATKNTISGGVIL